MVVSHGPIRLLNGRWFIFHIHLLSASGGGIFLLSHELYYCMIHCNSVSCNNTGANTWSNDK